MSLVFINSFSSPGGLIQGFMVLHKYFETSNTKLNTLGQREVKTFADIIIIIIIKNAGIAFPLLFRSLVLIYQGLETFNFILIQCCYCR